MSYDGLVLALRPEHTQQVSEAREVLGLGWPAVDLEESTVTLENNTGDDANTWLMHWDELDTVPAGVDLLCTVIVAIYESLYPVEKIHTTKE
tara:strand:- start:437 stop:712 length:276 start_codon:yes stop_codon:yes gene_type:complete